MIPPNVNIVVSPSAEVAAVRCAAFLAERLSVAIEQQGAASFAISGGSSPKMMFGLLAASKLDWNKVQLFWVDERCVPPDDPASNYRMAKAALVDPAGIPAANVHRVRTELEPSKAAADYAGMIEEICGGRFDVVHRGIGPDAHTASLFPGEPMIIADQGLTAAVWVEKFQQWRVTLTPQALRAAQSTAVFAPGEDKAQAIESILQSTYNPLSAPAQITVRNGTQETWFLDPGSAKALTLAS